jgi:hypothetical protein
VAADPSTCPPPSSPPVSLFHRSWLPSASIAGRVLGSVVARPIARMPKIPRRARKDEPAAASTPHLPAGDEGSEPLSQRPVCAAVPACRRTPTTAGALALLDPAASARPACRDYLPVPTDAGERAHVGRTRSPLKVCSSSNRR